MTKTKNRNSPDAPARPRPAGGWRWPLLAGTLMTMSLGVCTATIVLAVNDPNFGLEEDYYQKAVRWDEFAAQRAHNEELGWRAEVDLVRADPRSDPVAGPDPDAAAVPAELRVRLLDRDGEPLTPDRVEAMLFHHARRSDVRRPAVAIDADGVARARLEGARDGLWQVRLRFRHGGEVFTARVDTLTSAGGGA